MPRLADSTPHSGITPRLALRAVLVVVLAYAAAMVWLVSQETRLVFQAGPAMGERRPAQPWMEVQVPRQDGVRQVAWQMPVAGADATAAINGNGGNGQSAANTEAQPPWILYLHGNASTIAGRLNIWHYEQLRALGLNVLAAEYRGYGGLDGVPSEQALAEDARAAYDYLRTQLKVPAGQILIYGWSLGSAVAVTLAADVDEAAVILEGAPASLVAIGQQQYPYFPIGLLMRNRFESIQRIARVEAPLLFLHSPADTIIPIAEGRRLYDAALPPKSFVEVEGGHIYASETDPRGFFGAIRHFLQTHRLIPAPRMR
jgi:fermentation-respiration switch protein FrsA (DUF1100 family)